MFSPDGSYQANLTVDGRTVRVRNVNGLHLTPEGGRHLALVVLDAVSDDLGLAGG